MARHDREEVFDVTIPKETPEGGPIRTAVKIHPGEIVEAEIIIPDGPVGLAGVRIVSGDGPVWPITPGSWFRGNNERIKRETHKWPTSGDLHVEAYNTDKFPHTFSVRFAVRELRKHKPFHAPEKRLPLVVNDRGEIVVKITGRKSAKGRRGRGGGSEQQPVDEATTPDTGARETPEQPETPAPTETGEPAPAAEPAAPAEAGGGTSGESGGLGEAQPSSEGGGVAPPPRQEHPTGEQPPAAEQRTEAPPTASLPSTTYTTVEREVHNPPATGFDSVSDRVPGHPELNHGISILVNIVRKRWPLLGIKRTTGGTFPIGSIHHQGDAADLAGPDDEYDRQAAEWVKDKLRRYLTQGLHGPSLSVSDSVDVANDYWDQRAWTEHDKLIHLAVGGRQATRIAADNQPTVGVVVEQVEVPAPKRAPVPVVE